MDSAIVQNALRITSLALLISATLVDPAPFKVLVRADVQVVIAAIVVFLILFADHIFGFILGLSVIVLYSRVFINVYGIDIMGRRRLDVRNGSSNIGHVTPQNLEEAQSNVFDPSMMNVPYKGVSGVYGESVYSAQGYESASASTSSDNMLSGLPNQSFEQIGTF